MIASKGLATRLQFSSVAGKEMSEGAAREITRMFQGSPRELIRAALAAYDKDKDPTKLLQVLLRSPDGELRSAAADCMVRRYPDQLLNIQAFSPQGYQAVLEVLLRNIGEERYPSDGSAPAILALRVFKQEMDIRNLAVQVLVCSRGRNSFLARYVKQEDLEHHCRQLSLDPNTDQELLLQLVTSSGAMRDWAALHLPPERLPRRDFFGRLVLPSIAFSRD